MSDFLPLIIIDETENPPEEEENTELLPEEFGRNLNSIMKARLWLTNPNNWHDGNLYILKWNGLLCTVSREHGERLRKEQWDDGLSWAVVHGQKRRLASSGSLDSFEEPRFISDPDNS